MLKTATTINSARVSALKAAFTGATAEQLAAAIRDMPFRSPKGQRGRGAPERVELRELLQSGTRAWRAIRGLADVIQLGRGSKSVVVTIRADVVVEVASRLRVLRELG